MKLSDYVMEFVADQGVRDVFMVAGGAAMHLNDSLGHHPRLRYVCNLHEQACSVAADAYARATDNLGVALVTVGPGATNTLTGLAGSWLDSTPVLIISGQVKRADMVGCSGLRNRGVQELDIVELVRPLTKYAVTITDASTIRYHLEKAVHLARSRRPGPVWIDIPLDVQAQEIEPATLAGYTPSLESQCEYVRQRVRSVMEMLDCSSRPLLWLGNGVRLAHGLPEMRQLVELLGVPVALTWPALDFLPDDHPLLVGRPGPMATRGANFSLQNCDFLLTIGARLDTVCTAFNPQLLARGAAKVMVDIDHHEIARMDPFVQETICCDARDFLDAMVEEAGSVNSDAWAEWRARCSEWRARYPLTTPEPPKPEGLVSMYEFTWSLCEQLTEGALVVPASSGNAVETFLLAYRAKRGQRVFNTTALGPMGFGLPAAIGACVATGQETVCIEADGGLQMNIQELETVRRMNLPIKLFVINNGGYGSIVASQGAYFHRLTGCTPDSGLTLPDTLKLAQAYGIPFHRIELGDELKGGILAVLNASGPQVCEVMVIPDELRQPRVVSYQTSDGSMRSRPMEDLFPSLPRDEFRENMIVQPVGEP